MNLSITEAFSFTEIKPYLQKVTQEPTYATAFDGKKLAYYEFMPQSPKAAVLFYHGGGIYSANFYHHMAQELAQKHNIASYLFDIRGHGKSQGKRGDTPTPDCVWKDVDTAIQVIKENNPSLPLFLAGHSSGAGVILNYENWKKPKNVDGYILLAPYLGADSNTVRESQKFVPKVRTWVFALQGMTHLNFFYHIPTLYFNYPAWLKAQDSDVLDYYTCGMAIATSPHNAQAILANMETPCAIFDGEKEEQFYPERVLKYIEYLPLTVQSRSLAKLIPQATHLSIILDAPTLISQFIAQSIK